MNYQGYYYPPLKIHGSKMKLLPWISSVIPSNFDGTFIEPFLGSGAVGFNLAKDKAILCDTNEHVIRFYESIRLGYVNPTTIEIFLNDCDLQLKKQGEDFYYAMRQKFNQCKDPILFLFLSKMCFNGIIKFNQKGEFNTPFNKQVHRLNLQYINKIKNQIQFIFDKMKKTDIVLKTQGFEKTIEEADENSLIYCDPPYLGRNICYKGGWNEEQEQALFSLLESYKGKFILSTWKQDDETENPFFRKFWSKFNVLTHEKLYTAGGMGKRRKIVLEALVKNF